MVKIISSDPVEADGERNQWNSKNNDESAKIVVLPLEVSIGEVFNCVQKIMIKVVVFPWLAKKFTRSDDSLVPLKDLCGHWTSCGCQIQEK